MTMTSITNPRHPLPEEIVASLNRFEEENTSSYERQAQVLADSRPTADERQIRLRERSNLNGNGHLEEPSALKALREEKFDRVRTALERSLELDVHTLDHIPWEHLTPFDEPIDHSFWWAETRVIPSAHIRPEFRDDGLHFFGGPTHHSGSLFNTSYGALAFFAIDSNRIPHSSSGRWTSAPHIELFGGLDGYTGDSDIFTGDLWAKCWLHTRQTILQFGFGPTGPVPIILGEARNHQVLIFEENADRLVHVNLPGFKWMPGVSFGGVNTASTIWSHLEIRFDIQLEGAGTLLWANPDVLIRTFQWPLSPL
jgi:hypothetical protein